MYKEKIKEEINKALSENSKSFALERPKIKEHGDVATNIAMILSKELKKNPFDIANEIAEKIKLNENLISKIEVAKPGFINITVGNDLLSESISEVHKLGDLFGFDKPKSKEKILLEYVSANPTGDLHIGHGRQAVIGSCLANLLEASGYDVKREFYINDYGEQIAKLTESSWAIYEKLQGKNVEWKDDYYPEELLISYVKESLSSNGENPSKENLGQKVKEIILKSQKDLLASFNVTFDEWFSETKLHKENKVKETLEKLKKNNATYEKEGAIWFKAEEFGDVRDRVLVRADGRPTYLAADIAYHENKLNRGSNLINLWGADHHGQEVGLKGALKSIGLDENKLEVIFVQMVSLKKEGQEVKMSKRAGTVVTVAEVLEEVGSDAFRYFLIESHPNNRMVFDIDLAKKQDKDNPVYYVQYAHARCCSIFRQVKEQVPNIDINDLEKKLYLKETFSTLFKVEDSELKATKNLILKILDFPEEVDSAARLRSPSKIANYLKELAGDFHQFYTVCRVISKDENLTKARLGLIKATKITIANGLKILGVSAPESM